MEWRPTLYTTVVILLTAMFGVGRFLVPTRSTPTPNMTYEALAHVFVGGLFAGWLCTRESLIAWVKCHRWLLFWAATVISLEELLMFLILRNW